MATFLFEPGADGKPQTILPGAEHTSIAKRRASAPLKPTKPQKACDIGLFSDDIDQIDLEDWLIHQSEH